MDKRKSILNVHQFNQYIHIKIIKYKFQMQIKLNYLNNMIKNLYFIH